MHSSSAPSSSVLPAPVSPVRTLKPSPNSSRASSMTPKPWAYNSTNCVLGMTLSQALAQTKTQLDSSRRHNPHGAWAATYFNGLTGVERADRSAIGADDAGLVVRNQSNHLRTVDHDRTIDREVRSDWRHDHHQQRGVHDRTSGREVVAGTAGRRRHHYAVSRIGQVLVIVDESLDTNHVTRLRPFHDALVQRELFEVRARHRDQQR